MTHYPSVRSLYPSPHPCDAAFKSFRYAGFNVGVCGGFVHVTRPGGEQAIVAHGATDRAESVIGVSR